MNQDHYFTKPVSCDEEVDIRFGENTEIKAEDIYEVLVGTCADGNPVSTLCENSTDPHHKNTVLYHHREKFALEPVERVEMCLYKGTC